MVEVDYSKIEEYEEDRTASMRDRGMYSKGGMGSSGRIIVRRL